MTPKQNPPSISETAFDCPHCGAYTTQHWYRLSATQLGDDHRTPIMPGADAKERFRTDKDLEPEMRASLMEWVDKMDSGLVFFEKNNRGTYAYNDVNNLHVSECFNCRKYSVWVHRRLVFPGLRQGVGPNPDLPDDIRRDFEEARLILNESPRGAAALLRLCIQKLCAFLGEKGKNIDDDIASLVGKGLNPLVQQSLDIVRVVGNDAVHPGVLDLRDDQESALQLLSIVNLIAEQMISHPKTIQAMYGKLPEGKRVAIEKRSERARPDPPK